MVFPIVYLLILGNAMNRPLEGVPLAVVDEAGNAWSAECRRGVLALESGRRLVTATFVGDRASALDGLRRNRYRGIWVLPFGLSPTGPAPSFIGDNTDRFSFETLESALAQIWQEVSAPKDVPPAAPPVRLEAYPYLDYLTYLGPAVVCLAIFMGSMVSGGLQVLEDRMYGYHEGYLVTPISTGTLVAGHILAGAIVASIAGGLVLAGIVFLTPLPPVGGRSLAGGAPDRVPDVALDRGALVPALRAGAQREPPARDVRHHQRAALLPVGSALPDRVVPAVAGEGLGDRPADLRRALAAQPPPARCRARPSYADWVFLATFTVVAGVLTKVLFRREV